MDLHKVLNRLVADCSEEDIAGAQTYGLGADDRPAVEAFMRGVNSTAGLKFDHPGLAATATRVGPRLTIQNDIGATDAHVIVIAVENSSVIYYLYGRPSGARPVFYPADQRVCGSMDRPRAHASQGPG